MITLDAALMPTFCTISAIVNRRFLITSFFSASTFSFVIIVDGRPPRWLFFNDCRPSLNTSTLGTPELYKELGHQKRIPVGEQYQLPFRLAFKKKMIACCELIASSMFCNRRVQARKNHQGYHMQQNCTCSMIVLVDCANGLCFHANIFMKATWNKALWLKKFRKLSEYPSYVRSPCQMSLSHFSWCFIALTKV